jgi:hypothetical protein
MYSENGVMVDFDEVRELIAEADVFAVGFANFAERLLVDTRSDANETPLVQVVEPADSPRQRLRWLSRRRPTLGTPQSFSFFAWPHSPGFMVESGVWERICRRAGAEHEPEVAVQCELALKQLQNLDREAALSALRGERCVTLWPQETSD